LLAMFQQAFFTPMSNRNSENNCFSVFTTFHIRGGLPPGVWCLLGLSREGTTDITTWSRACLHCQQAKIHRHTRLQPQLVPILQRCFSHLHIDLVGPYSTVAVAISFSLSLIAHPNGWKQFLCLTCLRRHVLKL
jgi:hypothetical protein